MLPMYHTGIYSSLRHLMAVQWNIPSEDLLFFLYSTVQYSYHDIQYMGHLPIKYEHIYTFMYININLYALNKLTLMMAIQSITVLLTPHSNVEDKTNYCTSAISNVIT